MDTVDDVEYVDSASERPEIVRWRFEPYSVSFSVSRDSLEGLKAVASLFEAVVEVDPERCFRSLEIPELATS